eukprot:scaffold27941_cov58-Phaeocystis_antarctica.AAC.5
MCPSHRFRPFSRTSWSDPPEPGYTTALLTILAYYLLTTCLLLSILNPRPEERRLLPKSSRPRALPLHAKAQTISSPTERRQARVVESVPVEGFGEASVDLCRGDADACGWVHRVNLASTDGCVAMEIATLRDAVIVAGRMGR